MDESLTIGELARRTGVPASAIRYYEAEGVLPAPARVSGQRRYGQDALRRLAVLTVAKRAGFRLDEAAELLRGAPPGQLAARKLPELEEQLARAQAQRDWLALASACACPTVEECVLFAG